MRIVIDGRVIQDHFPGIARYTFHLARALPRVAPEVEIRLLYDPSAANTRYDLGALARDPQITLVPHAVSPQSLADQWRTPPVMRRQRPDVIHAPYFLRPYRAPAPVVLTVYDLIPLVLPQDYSRRERFIFRVGMRLSLRTARLALAISQATADDFVHVFGTARSRLRVTPLAPGAAFRPQSQQAIDATRQRLHLDGEYVLYLGSNKPHKNLSSLTDAWAQIAAGHTDVTLAIAGHWDPRFPQAREEVAAAGLERRVRFVGSVAPDDLPALYSGARLFCFPSLYEGFGLPVLEAMACGTPVVCSDASSLPEVAGDAALLVDPHDAEALAAALHRVLSDAALRDDLAERSLARAGAFSWARTARQTLRAYREVAR